MSKNTVMGLALLLVGVISGAVGAQVLPSLQPDSFLNSGLFTVAENEVVRFSVSLDDRRAGPPATVLMRLLDAQGTVVARRDVTLQAGASATLLYRKSGEFRAHADIVEPDSAIGARRIILGTVEISSTGSTGDPTALNLDFGTDPRFVCSMNDGAGNGRLPD
jgi:hypothetical protein